jgi:hypothetical protein
VSATTQDPATRVSMSTAGLEYDVNPTATHEVALVQSTPSRLLSVDTRVGVAVMLHVPSESVSTNGSFVFRPPVSAE